jgi:ComF family protein
MKYTLFTVLWERARRAAARIIFFLREYFFPAGCALCGVTLLDMNETWYGLCKACRAELADDMVWMGGADTAVMENRCGLCGKPMVSGKDICLSCRNGPVRPYERMITVFSYSGKYRKLFGSYKFGRQLALGHFFAEIIIKAYRLLQAADSENQLVIVPVPPRPGKIKKAGWDQVEYLARLAETGRAQPRAAVPSGVPVCRCLKRLPSKVQKKLNRKDRLQNLAGRILLAKPPPPAAVIIDDVITTGTTMDVCASALKAGGCQTVYGICLVYD